MKQRLLHACTTCNISQVQEFVIDVFMTVFSTTKLDEWPSAEAREAVAFLQGLGLGHQAAHRLLKRYGADTQHGVAEDPYKALMTLDGFNLRHAY